MLNTIWKIAQMCRNTRWPERIVHRLLAQGVIAAICWLPANAQSLSSPADYVDPTIGNVATFLRPTYPFVHQPNQMLRTYPIKSGYIADQITAFPLQITTHRGRGVLPLRVSVGELQPGSWKQPMAIDHDLQIATPWFYQSNLIEDDITVRLAPGKKAAIYRFDFPESKQKNILITGKPGATFSSHGPGAFTIEENVHYESRHNAARPDSDMAVWCYGEVSDVDGNALKDVRISARDGKVSILFGTNAPSGILFKYALSYVSKAQAKTNFRHEVASKDLSTLSEEARSAWELVLSSVIVKGGTESQKRSFYSAMYRCHERMVDINEDGRYYSGYDETIHRSDRPFYVDEGAWDTYRALHPLRTIIHPAQQEDMLHSLTQMSAQDGNRMPTYARATGNHPCMVGYHSASFFLDAHRKGLGRFDVEAAYEGIHNNLTNGSWIPWRQGAPRTDIDRLTRKLGYMPSLHPGEAETEPLVHSFERRQPVAVTLSRAFDTWTLSEFARDLSKTEDHQRFRSRSLEYKRIWHPKHRLFMPKDSAGNWVDINPKSDGGLGFRDYFDENNGWTYAWLVQHDIDGLMKLLGGPEAMASRLDQLFREGLGMKRSEFFVNGSNSTGMVGQFSMGNELSLHIPYLYNYCGVPWKTQQRTRFLLDVWFKDNIFGMPGDEDGGALGAWVVFTSMGFYPVTPGIPIYTITSPIFSEVSIRLPQDRVFKVSAPGASKRNKYILGAWLNGKALESPFITHKQIMAGGELKLELGEKPNREWGIKSYTRK